MIEIQNATKRFGGLAALEHLNLQIKPGHFAAPDLGRIPRR